MQGIQTENTADKDGGENIGFIQNGDWASYEIVFPETGTYRLSFRVATGGAGGSIGLNIDGESIAQIDVLNEESNGWQDWYTTKYIEVGITEGTHNIRLDFQGDSGFLFNLNWFNFDLYITTSVPKITQNRVKYFPNPAYNYLVIENIKSTAELTIFNLLGGEEIKQTLSETNRTIELSKLSQGLYVGTIEQNGTKQNFKFIKQ